MDNQKFVIMKYLLIFVVLNGFALNTSGQGRLNTNLIIDSAEISVNGQIPLLYTFEKDSIMYSILTIGSNEFEIGIGNKTIDSITFNYEKSYFKIDKKKFRILDYFNPYIKYDSDNKNSTKFTIPPGNTLFTKFICKKCEHTLPIFSNKRANDYFNKKNRTLNVTAHITLQNSIGKYFFNEIIFNVSGSDRSRELWIK